MQIEFFKKVLDKLNGLYYPREYICLAKELLSEPLNAYLVVDNLIVKDITNGHLFIGYKPLIIALSSFDSIELSKHPIINICLTTRSHKLNTRISAKNKMATLSLKYIRYQHGGHNDIYYYEGTHGQHRFLLPFQQFILRLSNQMYNNKPGNIFLPGNLYEQVQIAYALPRSISLITICSNNAFNLFPSDLNGQINKGQFIISLRHAGKVCQQVETIKNLVITEIHASYFKEVYALGKNHMKDLRSIDNFNFSSQKTESFHLPLPRNALHYRELILQDSFVHGIHKVFLFKILAHKKTEENPCTLSHIHNTYATWRHKNGLPGNYVNI